MEPKMMQSVSYRPRIGFVSLGQGPRPDLEAYHDHLLSKAGIEATIIWRHALDPISADVLASMAARDGEPAIRTNLRQAGATSALGPGWTARWLDRESFVPLVQSAIDELEAQDDVDLTIICAAEEFPVTGFTSTRPVVLPCIAMAVYAQLLANTKPNAKIGLLVYGDRQRPQQQAGWAAKPWAKDLNLVFCGHGNDLDVAAEELRPHAPDLVLLWAYGAGVAPGKVGPDELAATLGAPVISAAVASLSMAVNLLPLVHRRCEQ
jgi:protein AroM